MQCGLAQRMFSVQLNTHTAGTGVNLRSNLFTLSASNLLNPVPTRTRNICKCILKSAAECKVGKTSYSMTCTPVSAYTSSYVPELAEADDTLTAEVEVAALQVLKSVGLGNWHASSVVTTIKRLLTKHGDTMAYTRVIKGGVMNIKC